MAIRLRLVNGKWKAYCAAQTAQLDEDVYLDDAQDHALRKKLFEDWDNEAAPAIDRPIVERHIYEPYRCSFCNKVGSDTSLVRACCEDCIEKLKDKENEKNSSSRI